MTKSRKKILFIITLSNFGGAQKYVFDLATGLDRNQFDVAVAAGGDGELFTKLESAGVKIFKLKHLSRPTRPIGDLLAYFEIKKLIKSFKPDILHLNSSKPSILGALAAKDLPIKIVYTVHGAVFEASFYWLAKKIFLWLEKFFSRYKHKIICVSEADRAQWLKYKVAPPEKLITIHNGIAPIDFFSKEEAKKQLSKNYGLDSELLSSHMIIGWNGWFYPEKNLTALIKAAALILTLPKKQNEKIIFLLFGSGQEEMKLKSLAKELKIENKILFPGAVASGARYLKAFDLFALPSTKEGFPYAILEAMAAGVPITASNIGGIPEMIVDNYNGFLIAPTDYEAMAERILQILENSEISERFSQNSLKKIKEFSLENMILQTQKLYFK